jgi:hypothetical protein
MFYKVNVVEPMRYSLINQRRRRMISRWDLVVLPFRTCTLVVLVVVGVAAVCTRMMSMRTLARRTSERSRGRGLMTRSGGTISQRGNDSGRTWRDRLTGAREAQALHGKRNRHAGNRFGTNSTTSSTSNRVTANSKVTAPQA